MGAGGAKAGSLGRLEATLERKSAERGGDRRTVLLLAAPYVAYAVAIPLIRLLSLAFVVAPDLRLAHFEDDAFYYFRTAEHIADGDGATFNGLEPTNGFHPLWMALLVPVFAVSDGTTALVGVELLQGIVWAVGIYAAWRLARRTGLEAPMALGLLPMVLVGTLTGASADSLYFSGMEAVVGATLVLVLLEVSVAHCVFERTAPPPRALVGVGVVLALFVAARLDGGFLAALFVLVAAASWRATGLRERIRPAALLAAPTALFLAAYLTFNAVYVGSPLPVSGQAKSLLGLDVGTAPLAFFLAFGELGGVVLNLGTVAAVLVAAALGLRSPASAEGLRRPLLVVFLGLGGQVLYACLVISSWPIWSWYAYLVPVVVAVAAALVIGRAQAERGLSDRRLAVATLVVAAAVLAWPTAQVARNRFEDVRFQEGVIALTTQAAELTERSVPRGEVIAMGDRAGSFGYLVDRPVVQLEGLADTPELVDALREGRIPEVLRERDVRYVAVSNWGSSDQKFEGEGNCQVYVQPIFGLGPKSRLVLCRSDRVFEITGANQFYGLWRYRPEIQDEPQPESAPPPQ